MDNMGWWSYIRYDEQQDKPTISMALLRRVGGYAAPYRGRISIMLFTIIGITLLSLIPPLLFRDLIDHALPGHDATRLDLLALGMVLVPLASGGLGLVQRWLSSQIGEGVIADLRVSLFAHLQRMSLRFFTNTRTGELMSRLNNDVVGAQRAVTSTMLNIVSNVISLVSVLGIMLFLEWRLTLLSVVLLPIFIFPARRVGHTLRAIIRRQLTLNAEMNALMNEDLNVSGALLVKLFGRMDDENTRMTERAHGVRDAGIRQSVVSQGFFLGLGLASAGGTALVFWVGGHLVLSGVFTIGTVVAFSTYLGQLYGPLTSITNSRLEFATSLVSFERVFEVLDLPVEIHDRPGAVSLGEVNGAVEFDHVSFAYRNAGEGAGNPVELSKVQRMGQIEVLKTRSGGSSVAVAQSPDGKGNGSNGAAKEAAPPPEAAEQGPRYALQDVSFKVQPGRLVALVGQSGAGKTTITYLLPRLYDVTSGSICVDGHDIRDVTLDSLSESIGMVTQESYLFHDTIRANLLYARPDATVAQIEAACRAANIHDFIADLPDGYETIVGERGYRLSGGEKQRIAIARVILKDPRILVLDEATSALDSQTEALIQEALERVMEGRTSLVIAHRLSTILAADLILVLQAGRLVEQGTHAELLAQGAVYASLYQTQFRHAPGGYLYAKDMAEQKVPVEEVAL
ncbi:MAG: ABC transporter ATP-binding protein [Chloroflexia bacterium]